MFAGSTACCDGRKTLRGPHFISKDVSAGGTLTLRWPGRDTGRPVKWAMSLGSLDPASSCALVALLMTWC